VLLHKQKHFLKFDFRIEDSRLQILFSIKALTQLRERFCMRNLAFVGAKARFHHLLFFTLILGPFLPEFLGS